ncbi:MAG: DEAD/DEAH box helicase [Leptospirales bacterium]
MSWSGKHLPPGLYEQLIDSDLRNALLQLQSRQLKSHESQADPAELPFILSRFLQKRLLEQLRSYSGSEAIPKQMDLASRVLSLMGVENGLGDPSHLSNPEILLEIGTGIPTDRQETGIRPLTGLSESTLFTGSREDPTLASELAKEIHSADRIDLLMSFIKWSGFRILKPDLVERARRGGVFIRIVTTTYMGATDQDCLDELADLPHTEIRVSLDTSQTRLHAKAWFFGRNTGYSTAYIGSSNLSNPAMTNGLEWNLKITSEDMPDILEKFCGTFESYWNDPATFHPYTLERREEVRQSLEIARARPKSGETPVLFELSPFPFQKEILEKLEVERTLHQSTRNLVVAATGTGKTFIAAFDFKRFRKQHPEASFLFVAHREEILKQSLFLFRNVLGDRNFGELLTGREQPRNVRHLFASIQTLHRSLDHYIPHPEAFDFVVVDEIHHAMAPTYRALLDRLNPGILLGLTATPERHDGLDIRAYFNGRIASEIRLGEAIDRNLLCPFHYFGVSDNVDYRSLRWERGQYDRRELEDLLTGNDLRNRSILQAVREYFPDLSGVHGLGFCVSVRHAREMSEIFNRSGIASAALWGDSSNEERQTVPEILAAGTLRFVFVVDLYNEGVDIPAVNTLLFLRPTDSLTVFLQQLGRGLRHDDGKTHLTVLDFIGHMHQKFDFVSRLSALTGNPAHRIPREVEEGFPYLPASCVIRLEKVAREHVLENIRQSLSGRRDRWLERIRSLAEESGRPPSLSEFIKAYHPPLSILYRKDGRRIGGWKRTLVMAGVIEDFSDPDETVLSRGIARLFHVRSGRYHDFLKSLAQTFQSDTLDLEENEIRLALMAHYSLWQASPREMGMEQIQDSIIKLRNNPTMCEELTQILEWIREEALYPTPPLDLPGGAPLDLHAEYTRDEIMASFGLSTFVRKGELREGVKFIPDLKTDLLFITLNKSEKEYSPSTLYEDYAISDQLFHWQSQSTTSSESPTGQRYIHHRETGGQILLFVRKEKKPKELPLGLSAPYIFLGPARYGSHRGSRPMSIVWELLHPMPAHLLRESARLAVRL